MLMPWRTLRVGTHASVSDLVRAMEAQGSRASLPARDALSVVTVEAAPGELVLARCSLKDLGFEQAFRIQGFCAHALSRGLCPCPSETALQLRRQYPDQPHGEWLRVVTDPLKMPDGRLVTFAVGHAYDELRLDADLLHSDPRWPPGTEWVFTLKI